MAERPTAMGSQPTETTPLINAEPDDEPGRDQPDEDEDRPLPKAQLFMMCYTRLVEPLGFFSIFPFVNQMIRDTGVPESDVGFWSGLVESSYSIVQCVVMFFWGRASDRFGRKPVLSASLVGLTVTLALFGVSTTVGQMIGFRAAAGVFAASLVTLRAMISEISTKKTQAWSFSVFAFAGNISIFIGPFIGGLLADPASQYPGSAFARITLFQRFPYSLPCFVVGIVSFSALIVSFFIKETLVKKPTVDGKKAPPSMSTLELVRAPGVAMVLFIYTWSITLGLAFTAVLPVFWFTPARLGGYGFTPARISLFLGLSGGCQALWLLCAFPPLQARIGTRGVLRFSSCIWLVSLPLYPIWNLILRHRIMWLFWTGAPVLAVLASSAAMSFTAVQLALNDICPSPDQLGTLNALSLTSVSAVRAFAPALFASLYAYGVRNQILGGQLVWVVLEVMAASVLVVVSYLPEKAWGRPERPKAGRAETVAA